MGMTAAERKRAQVARGGTESTRLRAGVIKAASKALTEWLRDSSNDPRLSDLVRIASGAGPIDSKPPEADLHVLEERFGPQKKEGEPIAVPDLRKGF